MSSTWHLIGNIAKLRAALVDMMWIAVADEAEACKPSGEVFCSARDPAPLCRVWRALGYGKHWPGYVKAEDRLPTRDHGRRGIR
jgi:hypothetical protein